MPAVTEQCKLGGTPSLQKSDDPQGVHLLLVNQQSDPTLSKGDNQCDPLFKSVEELKTTLVNFFYGNLYLVGQVWISALQAALVGAKLCLIPTVQACSVHAAPVLAASVRDAPVRAGSSRSASHGCKGPEPEKPPKMKRSDLPYYECPHTVYKDLLEDKSGCPKSSDKIIHMMILPYVSRARRLVQCNICCAKCRTHEFYYEAKNGVENAHKKLMQQLRDPDNLNYRRGIVVSAATICGLASGKGIAKRIFWSSFGAATSGMVCFPKETDKIIKEVFYFVSNGLIVGHNKICSREPIKLRQRRICEEPEELPNKSVSVCEEIEKKDDVRACKNKK